MSAFGAAAVRQLGGPSWLAIRREHALERFFDAPTPTGDEDAWRYSRIGQLALGRFVPAGHPGTGSGGRDSLPGLARRLLADLGAVGGLVVTRDGFPVLTELGERATEAGVRLGPASLDPQAEALMGDVISAFPPATADGFAALADAFSPEAVVLRVPAGAEIAEPILIVHVIGDTARHGRPAAVFPRTLVHLEESSEASVIELLLSPDGEEPVLVLPTTELSVSVGARLSHDLVQQLGSNAWQLGRLAATAGRDATLRSFQASLGGSYARAQTDSILTGQGGSTQLLAAFFGDGSQMHDFRTLQEHAAPRTTSDLVFKGAVADTSRSVYNGLIKMRNGAKGASAFQTNRNLVLSDGAHADSVPNLEIEENDVRCSHASAVGPVDEEQRFYLESRGVPAKVAERLILLGFFAELLEKVNPSVGTLVLGAVAGRVGAAAR